MVGGGSQKIDNLDAGDIELDFDDGQFIQIITGLIVSWTNWVFFYQFICLNKDFYSEGNRVACARFKKSPDVRLVECVTNIKKCHQHAIAILYNLYDMDSINDRIDYHIIYMI